MKIIAIGSKGQLGHELLKQGERFGFEVLGFDLPELDITDPIQVDHLITSAQAHLVVNAAAYTQVDKAETDKILAFAVNRDGPENIARSCAKTNLPLIHISTDYVFDGCSRNPYTEADRVSPIGIYGQSKAAGEKKVQSEIKRHIIIRTAWLYSIYGHNFVKTMLRLGKEKKTLRVVGDQFGSPTSAADLAEAVLTIARRIQNADHIDWGIYHYCGHGITTWHRFADKIFEIARRSTPIETTRIEPIPTAEFPTAAKRPMYSVLDCRRIKQHFGIHPKPWEKSLEDTIIGLIKKNE